MPPHRSILSWAAGQEYEELKAEARARGLGPRDEMADIERRLAAAKSILDQLQSEEVSHVTRPNRSVASL